MGVSGTFRGLKLLSGYFLKGAWKAKRELMAGILNLSPHQNVHILKCEQGYHTVKCLGSNSVKQFCFFPSRVIFSHHSCRIILEVMLTVYVSSMQSLTMKLIYLQENPFFFLAILAVLGAV